MTDATPFGADPIGPAPVENVDTNTQTAHIENPTAPNLVEPLTDVPSEPESPKEFHELYTPVRDIQPVGASLGTLSFVSCRQCGAAIILDPADMVSDDPDERFDALTVHSNTH